MSTFNPNEHIMKLKGKDYLEVKWRLVWFRLDHPAESGWAIITEAQDVQIDSARFMARIVDPEGRTVATGTKTETKSGFGDFVEKAETGSIGRALALLGYGTQFCGDELDEGQRIVDSPVDRTPRPLETPQDDIQAAQYHASGKPANAAAERFDKSPVYKLGEKAEGVLLTLMDALEMPEPTRREAFATVTSADAARALKADLEQQLKNKQEAAA